MGVVSDRVSQFAKGAAINSQLTWGDVGAMKVSGRPVRNAFLDPRMVMLPAKTKLYKFNSFPSLRPDGEGNVTPWWSAFDGYDVDPGWHTKAAMAKSLRVSVRELGRVTSAITESWNSCEYLVVITLSVDMWVAYGRFRQMSRSDAGASQTITNTSLHNMKGMLAPPGPIKQEGRAKTMNLPGGGRQFFVPNLKPAYYTGMTAQSLLAM